MFMKPFPWWRAWALAAARILRGQISSDLCRRAWRPCYGEDDHGFGIGAAPIAGTVDW